MKEGIIIFSGTTEGRLLSEGLSAAARRHVVCVATDYGAEVMKSSPYASVHVERMDESRMTSFIKENEAAAVLDATHPYAREASANIKKACAFCGAKYERILRQEEDTPKSRFLRKFSDMSTLRDALIGKEGAVLLSTGTKELSLFTSDERLKERLFARVLPSSESIRLCEEAGLMGHQIIAMQGPFSKAMNEAILRQYRIRYMVAKESGSTGGFNEKVSACEACRVFLYALKRPREEGISVEEALLRYGKATGNAEGEGTLKSHIKVSLIGAGPGEASLLTKEARETVEAADLIFGAERLIKNFPGKEGIPLWQPKDIAYAILEKKPFSAAVLYSGDSGFFSGAKALAGQLCNEAEKADTSIEISILPGISSLSYLAAKTGEPYSGAALISLHGRSKEEGAFAEAIESIVYNKRTFLLLSGADDAARLSELMRDCGLSACEVILGCSLSYEDEEIKRLSVAEAAGFKGEGLIAALVKNPAPKIRTLMPILSDADFIRDRIPMTKELIRHIIMLRLSLHEGAVFYDVGSGTGSVAIEAAGLSPSVSVYAFEKRIEAAMLIRQNKRKLAALNVKVVTGEAPEVFLNCPPPTHVFIGGSSGRLYDIIRAIKEKASSQVRLVMTAVSIETIAALSRIQKEFDIEYFHVEQLSVAESCEAGASRLMKAENPVWIARGVL